MLDDPDLEEMKEYDGIGIFVPGTLLEREVSLKSVALVLVGAVFFSGLIMMFMLVPMIMEGLVRIDLNTGAVYFEPFAFLLLTVAELGFVVPPMYYVRKRGLRARSLGVKDMADMRKIAQGLGMGALMLGANFVFTYLMQWLLGTTGGTGEESMFRGVTPSELVLWIVVMFVVVGFSEELLFRGFMQRRLEIYFRSRRTHYRELALVITSLVFAAVHMDLVGLPARFVLGLLLGYLAQRQDYSIAGASVAHGLNNAIVVVFATMGY